MALKYALLLIGVVLAAGNGAGALCKRLGRPPILGQLLVGVVIANLLSLLAARGGGGVVDKLTGPEAEAMLSFLSDLGIILVLFVVGFESRVGDLAAAPLRSYLVAMIGAFLPFITGFAGYLWCARAWLPVEDDATQGFALHRAALFFGGMLAASSIGITLNTFRRTGRGETLEARFILSVAIVNDIIGLVVISVLRGLGGGTGAAARWGHIGTLAGGALLLIVATIAVAAWLGRLRAKSASRVAALASASAAAGAPAEGAAPAASRVDRALERVASPAAVFVFVVLLACAAEFLNLAAIIGAFCAGVLLSGFRVRGHREWIDLKQLIQPVVQVFIPLFFVRLGMQLDVTTLADPRTFAVALFITIVAMLSKLAAGFLAAGSMLSRVTVGVSLMPRCTVALVFASLGRAANWIDDRSFAVVILVVLATTLLSPSLLEAVLARAPGPVPAPAPAPMPIPTPVTLPTEPPPTGLPAGGR